MCECVSVSPCRTRTHNIPPLQTYFPLILMKLISQWDQQQVSIQFPCSIIPSLLTLIQLSSMIPGLRQLSLFFIHFAGRAGPGRGAWPAIMLGSESEISARDTDMVISKHNLSQSVSSVNNEQLSGRHQSSGPDFRRRFSYS